VAVPTPSTATANQLVTSSFWNTEVRDLGNFLLNPPRCYAYRNADKSTTSAATVVYDMDLEAYDSHAAHSNVTNNTRLTAPESGLYSVTCQAKWAAHASGSRRLQVRKNADGDPVSGSLVFDTAALPSSGNIGFCNGSVDVQLVAGDRLELFTNQTSGGNLNVIGGQGETYLTFRWCAKTV
jgi:hypothetical protein